MAPWEVVALVPPLAIGRVPETSLPKATVPPPERTPEEALTIPLERPEKVMVPEEVTPVAAAIAPEELTWN